MRPVIDVTTGKDSDENEVKNRSKKNHNQHYKTSVEVKKFIRYQTRYI